MRNGALARMAAEMSDALRQAQPPSAVWRPLRRGLIVVLERQSATEWRLAMGRTDVQPSAQEIAICRNAFGVPEGARLACRTQQRLNERQELVTYQIAELFWSEYETDDCDAVVESGLCGDSAVDRPVHA